MASTLSIVGAILAGIIFAMMSLLVVTEVVLRATVNESTRVTSEYSGYALATMIYLSLGFTFREGAHIRISFLNDRLPNKLRRLVEFLLAAFAAVVTSVAILAVWEMARTSYERGTIAYTVARTPLYIPQGVILVGLVILFIQLVAYALSVLVAPSLTKAPPREISL